MAGRGRTAEVPDAGRWTPLLIAGLVVAGVSLAASLGGGGHAEASRSVEATTTTEADVAAGALVAASAVPVTVAPTTTLPHTQLTRTITDGMTGDDVRQIQQRLKDLAFDPGPVDGVFGLQTIQAVWAFKKLIMKVPAAEVDGDVSPELWTTMQEGIVVFPRRTELTSRHIEVYLPEQVMVLFTDDVPTLITHVSTGSNQKWCEEVSIDPGEDGNENGTEVLKKGICGQSKTPGGQFSITRKFQDDNGDGWREGQLGRMYKPVYWNYGLAIHGSSKVPKTPASHGCVRLPMHIAEYFLDMVKKGDAVYVWDGVREPEAYGRQKPIFDMPDPNYATTTTAPPTTRPTTTTTRAGAVTTTTRPASTTTRPPATTVPAPATTVAPPATTVAPPSTAAPVEPAATDAPAA